MLVLARKLDESIVIGDNIIVKVVSVENGVVKLGIDAPQEISIMRSELLEQVKEQNMSAAGKTDLKVLTELSKILGKK
ncbi:MAG TPA: carbon storage regulator CsrA [Sulfurimonas sp.]|nr:carbon storage regulator CsrA [Sulfurimonas sp.]HIM76195.1 carbon storage regulator [Campylobacterales bacterium]